ncbi:hypothetical protein HIRU_S798 [Hirudovirus strain Sangsue]|uniref:F-box protein n=1 Tax=Acanthamoeba polyphaga mimivirus TaxID=212035 RepID=A0A0G2Y585_MIMIV|nr:hypothetical protein HIRU_S798 [Hirudovirus strain Sangsue]AKI78927.1 hypothetical protein [Acanthamoeba polyphaga mimivirus]
MDNINCLFNELLVIIIDFLSDHDKIKFITTCSRLYWFIDKIHYNSVYDYNKISHLSFVDKFKRIRFHAVNAGSIPSIVTDLVLDNNFTDSLKTCNLSKLLRIKLNFHQYKKNRNYILSNVKIDCSNSITISQIRYKTLKPTRLFSLIEPFSLLRPSILSDPFPIRRIQIKGYDRDTNYGIPVHTPPEEILEDFGKHLEDIDLLITKDYKKFFPIKKSRPAYIPIVSRNSESSRQSNLNSPNDSVKLNEFNKSNKSTKTNPNNIHNIVTTMNSNKNFHKNKYKYQNRIIPKHPKYPKKFSKNKYH